jgi:hypothetical protein
MDDQKNKILIAVIVFNITIMLYMGYKWIGSGLDGLSLSDFLIAIVVAGIAAGAAFGAATAISKK